MTIVQMHSAEWLQNASENILCVSETSSLSQQRQMNKGLVMLSSSQHHWDWTYTENRAVKFNVGMFEAEASRRVPSMPDVALLCGLYCFAENRMSYDKQGLSMSPVHFECWFLDKHIINTSKCQWPIVLTSELKWIRKENHAKNKQAKNK